MGVEPLLWECKLLWLLDHECEPLYRLRVGVPVRECSRARSSASRASSASQSVSCSMHLLLRQFLPLAHSTPRSASPIPVPRPPRTSPYWVRHLHILWAPHKGLVSRWTLKDLPPGGEGGRTYPRYSESEPLMPRPQGWQSQTPESAVHVHTALSIVSEKSWASELCTGRTRRPMYDFWQAIQRRRCLSRRTAGEGGFIAQFCRPSSLVKRSRDRLTSLVG